MHAPFLFFGAAAGWSGGDLERRRVGVAVGLRRRRTLLLYRKEGWLCRKAAFAGETPDKGKHLRRENTQDRFCEEMQNTAVSWKEERLCCKAVFAAKAQAAVAFHGAGLDETMPKAGKRTFDGRKVKKRTARMGIEKNRTNFQIVY